METSLKLKYTGPAVESGQMDVYQASANMIAFSEFMVIVAKATYGDRVDVRAEVAGFGRGSFITDLVFNVAGPIATIFSALSPSQLLTIVKEAFELWKHLGGAQPKSVEHTDNQTARVTNNNGQIIQVQTQTLNVVFSEKASDAVSQFVQGALSKDGMDALQIENDKKQVVARASQNEAPAFRLVAPSEPITDYTATMTLIIEAPVFKDDNKWRFSDGQNSFYADMHDKEFLARVDAGERFGKGDQLRVDMRITQERAGAKISAERAVMKVHEHRPGQQQTALF